MLTITTTAAEAKTNTVILSGADWLGGNGVDIYSNDGDYGSAANDINNINIGTTDNPKIVNTGYRWQCVELINRLYLKRGWTTTYWAGNGAEMYDNAPSVLEKSPNGSISSVGPGDVIVFGGGSFLGDNGQPAGHVLIVDSVNDKSIKVVSQNVSNAWSTLTWDKDKKKITPWSGYTMTGVVHAPSSDGSNEDTSNDPPSENTTHHIVHIQKSTYGSAQQVWSATKYGVFLSAWWPGSGGIHHEQVYAAKSNEQIVDFHRVVDPDGSTQRLYVATLSTDPAHHVAGVWEVKWGNQGREAPIKRVGLPNIVKVIADPRMEGSNLTHRLYVLANDGPYEYFWRGNGPVSDSFRLWNINGGHSLVKSTGADGKDEVYVGTPTNVYRMKWPVNGGIEKKTVTSLAHTTAIAKHRVGNTEYVYTATTTGVHETWFKYNPTTGTYTNFSPPGKIVITPDDKPVVAIEKTLTGSYQQLYVATSRHVYEYWWSPGSNGVQYGMLVDVPSDTAVDIERSVNGNYQQLYTAHQSFVLETWWGDGSLHTGLVTKIE
jgi:hypothetical protein